MCLVRCLRAQVYFVSEPRTDLQRTTHTKDTLYDWMFMCAQAQVQRKKSSSFISGAESHWGQFFKYQSLNARRFSHMLFVCRYNGMMLVDPGRLVTVNNAFIASL